MPDTFKNWNAVLSVLTALLCLLSFQMSDNTILGSEPYPRGSGDAQGAFYLESREPTNQSFLIRNNCLVANSPTYIPEKQVLATELDDEVIKALINCESGGRHEGVWGDKGRAYGKWQFWEATFYWLADLAGYKNLNWQTEADQDLVGKWALGNDYGYLWTCYQKY